MSETIPAHLRVPRLRAVEAYPVEHEGQSLVALRDASNLSDQVCVMSHAVLNVCSHFTGQQTVDEIAGVFDVDRNAILEIARSLDESLMLEGATLEAHLEQLTAEFDAMPILPIRAAAEVTAPVMDLALNDWKAGNPDRSGIECPEGLVAPHLDFERGRTNYAAAYAHLRQCSGQDRPERVIVFGTNHFGFGTGVVMCPKGFATTVGELEIDEEVATALTDRLGDRILRHRTDHTREHSVELQMPWIRHLLGPVPVLGFLIHDPIQRNGESYDGQGVGLDEFLTALRDTLDESSARTLFVCGADLSHVGRIFGDDFDLDPSRLKQTEEHDRRHLALLTDGKTDRFLDSMRRLENPTRWCTLGGMTALWRMLPDRIPTLIRYEQSVDNPTGGVCCVSSAAMALHSPS